MTVPMKRSSIDQGNRNRSWSKLVVELLRYVAIFVGGALIYNFVWDLGSSADVFIFTKYWLPSVIVLFALLVVSLLLEYRAYRLHRKLTNLTPLRLGLVIAIVCLFVFVQANGV
jgi:hypothetical protein